MYIRTHMETKMTSHIKTIFLLKESNKVVSKKAGAKQELQTCTKIEDFCSRNSLKAQKVWTLKKIRSNLSHWLSDEVNELIRKIFLNSQIDGYFQCRKAKSPSITVFGLSHILRRFFKKVSDEDEFALIFDESHNRFQTNKTN